MALFKNPNRKARAEVTQSLHYLHWLRVRDGLPVGYRAIAFRWKRGVGRVLPACIRPSLSQTGATITRQFRSLHLLPAHEAGLLHFSVRAEILHPA